MNGGENAHVMTAPQHIFGHFADTDRAYLVGGWEVPAYEQNIHAERAMLPWGPTGATVYANSVTLSMSAGSRENRGAFYAKRNVRRGCILGGMHAG